MKSKKAIFSITNILIIGLFSLGLLGKVLAASPAADDSSNDPKLATGAPEPTDTEAGAPGPGPNCASGNCYKNQAQGELSPPKAIVPSGSTATTGTAGKGTE